LLLPVVQVRPAGQQHRKRLADGAWKMQEVVAGLQAGHQDSLIKDLLQEISR
jgi:hypothetical protein